MSAPAVCPMCLGEWDPVAVEQRRAEAQAERRRRRAELAAMQASRVVPPATPGQPFAWSHIDLPREPIRGLGEVPVPKSEKGIAPVLRDAASLGKQKEKS